MPDRARHSLKDVARRAELSAATVSRYLNGSLDLPVATRARIEDAVAALGYRPNAHARRLSLGRSETLALVVPDIANPFFARIAAAMEAAAAARGQMVTLHSTGAAAGNPAGSVAGVGSVTNARRAREAEVLDAAARNLADGVVFLTSGGNAATGAIAERLNRLGRAVLVDEDVPGARVPRLWCDNREGGRLAGEALRRAGHRAVAYLGGPPELLSTRERLAGLEAGLGRPAAAVLAGGAHSVAAGAAIAKRLLDGGGPGVTAILAGSDELAVGVLDLLHRRGLRVPRDLSFVSFDDVRSLQLYAPPVTAVAQPVEALGRRAVELLLDGDWSDGRLRTHVETLPVRLAERASVAPPAARDQRDQPGRPR